MWANRGALVDLDLSSRKRVLDVGCGTGEFSAALRADTDAPVVGVDADTDLLEVARHGPGGADDDRSEVKAGHTGGHFPVVGGDALSLPVRDDAVDLAACQALLINLAEPAAAVEPDNAAVSVDSTVDREESLERRARTAYLDGVDTDVTLGAVDDLFREAGIEVISTRRHDHARTVEPPYDERDLRAARRKATGAGLAGDRATLLAGGLSPEEYDDLRAEWRAMGRSVVGAMERGEYRRRETVPFHVTVGRV